MNIIRDDGEGFPSMVALCIDWNLRRCNQRGCTNRPTTIITGAGPDGNIHFALCEAHFQQGNVPSGTSYDLVFDGFDAFAELDSPTDLG